MSELHEIDEILGSINNVFETRIIPSLRLYREKLGKIAQNVAPWTAPCDMMPLHTPAPESQAHDVQFPKLYTQIVHLESMGDVASAVPRPAAPRPAAPKAIAPAIPEACDVDDDEPVHLPVLLTKIHF